MLGRSTYLISKLHSSAATRSKLRRNPVQARSLAYIVVEDNAQMEKVKWTDTKKIYYFTASWCPPCRKIAPFFKDLSTKHENIDFVKIDVDTFPEMAHSFGVKSVPTFWTMNGKTRVTEFIGASERNLAEAIEELQLL